MKKIAILIILMSYGCSRNHNSAFEFKTYPVGNGANSVEVADLNHDGKPDIIVANTEDSSVSILLNQGNRDFSPAPGSPFGASHFPNDITIADFNHDGNLDLAFANHETSYLTILLGNGKGQFNPSLYSPIAVQVKPHTHGVISGYFDADSNLDIATESSEADSIVVLHGDGKGNFTNPVYYATGKHPYQRLRTADFNKDGYADIITTNEFGDSISVLLGDGKGIFTSKQFPAGIVPFDLAIGDLNKDGNLDLAIVNSPTISNMPGKDGLTILMGDGKGNFTILKGSPFQTGLGPTRLAIGDLNHDGYNDIALTNLKTDFLSIYYMGPHGVLSIEQIPFGMHANGISIADMDGDGKPDIIVSSPDDNKVVILYGK